MQNFMITLLVCTLVMSAVAVLYMLCSPLTSRRYSAKWLYYIWLVIIIGFIIPFRPDLGNSVVILEMPAPPASDVAFFAGTIEQRTEAAQIVAEQTVAQAGFAPANIPWWQLAFLLWLAGAVVFLAYHIVRHLLFVKAVSRWSEEVTDKRVLAIFEDIKSEIGIKGRVSLYVSPFGSPMAIGIIKPKIFLPTTDMEQSDLRFILMHELIHCKRKDLIYKYLVVLATALHWFNPIIYMVARVIDMLCEVSCDAEVVRDTDDYTRQSYGEALIGVVAYQTKIKTALSTNFYQGKKGMKTRISSIMNASKKRAGAVIACLVIVLSVGTSFAFSTVPVDAILLEGSLEGHYRTFNAAVGDTSFFLYRAEDVALESFNTIYAIDHSLLWDMHGDGVEIVIGADQPIYNFSLVNFFHYNDGTSQEGVFVQTEVIVIADRLGPGEAVLIHNYNPLYFSPWSIISFEDSQGEQHFFTIGHSHPDLPGWLAIFDITGLVWVTQ